MNNGSILTLDKLSAGYGTGDVISEVSFSLRQDEILCIAGQSGCGKSTLLRAIMGVFDLPDITGGSITLNGTVLTELPKNSGASSQRAAWGSYFRTQALHSTPYAATKSSSARRCRVAENTTKAHLTPLLRRYSPASGSAMPSAYSAHARMR